MVTDIPIVQVGDVLLSPDIITEYFCCDLDVCHGACCIEGDAGAPVTADEIGSIEESLDEVWGDLTARAQAVIDRQGVAYADPEGELVTSIVGGRDCVFACHADGCCLCVLERAWREGRTTFSKPVSCALYPIREKALGMGLMGLNYHRWAICEGGRRKGAQLRLPVYKFLRDALVRRFGRAWYDELSRTADTLLASCRRSS